VVELAGSSGWCEGLGREETDEGCERFNLNAGTTGEGMPGREPTLPEGALKNLNKNVYILETTGCGFERGVCGLRSLRRRIACRG